MTNLSTHERFKFRLVLHAYAKKSLEGVTRDRLYRFLGDALYTPLRRGTEFPLVDQLTEEYYAK